MTRNEAYKAAKKAWRFWFRRNLTIQDDRQSIMNAMQALSAQGYSTKDARIMALWLKAWLAGRRYPTESDMQRIEEE